MANATQAFDSVKSVQLQSSILIVDQDPDFGGGNGHLDTSSTLCVTFVSSDGSEWSTGALRTCQDAPRLPENPSFCYLNAGVELDVDMGTIERDSISTVPGGTNKKTIPLKVMCSGDATVTATFTFQYTPITVTGSEVISSNKNGLGIAVYINDKLMSTKNSITQDFIPGFSEVDLSFEVVRDPYVNIGDISTGDFSADAVLVLTKN